MAFTIEDFQDLVRLLEQHPEWQAELRRLLLAGDILDLPRLVRELAQAQLRTEERLGRLEQVILDLQRVVADLAEAQRRTEERLTELIAAQLRKEQAVQRLATDTDGLKGGMAELLYSRHASGYFGSILRRIHVLSDEELWGL